jgi:Fungal protein kinase
VFEAIEINELNRDQGADVVLKDIWIDTDRTREGAILAQLYNKANDQDKALVQRYSLTAICHGDVWIHEAVVDDTEKALMRNLPSPDSVFILRANSVSESQSGTGSEALRAMTRLGHQDVDLKYAHKTHYRIVFKEKGITIDRIPTLHRVLETLIETVDGAL